MRFRFDFLNWRPDIEPLANDGLVAAFNTVHQEGGYESVPLNTANAWATVNGSAGITMLSARALQVRPFGPGRTASSPNYGYAYIQAGATAGTLNISIGEAAGAAQLSATTNADATTAALSSFEACALGSQVFMCAYMDTARTGGTLSELGLSATMVIS